MTNQPTENILAITASFENFDKWETYGTCFKAITSGTATLAQIQTIAFDICKIDPGVIQMRMVDFVKMGPQTPANNRLIVALGGEV
jgi:hypothetical protein